MRLKGQKYGRIERESVDDKMEEQIGMKEVKNEKVRGKEEKID